MEIMKGAEAFSISNPSDIGVLLLHGYSGSPYEMTYVGEELGKAGFNVECPRLSGHGTVWQDMDRVRYTDWIRDAEYALKNLMERSKRIYIAGLSMGAALALRLAAEHPEVREVFLINPVIFLKGFQAKLLFIGRFLLRYKAKKKDKGNRRHIKDRSIKLVNYDVLPTKGAYQMQKLIGKVRKRIKDVYQPVLIFRSRDDSQLVRNVDYILNNLSSSDTQLIWLDNSYHVATMDFDRKFIVGKIIERIDNGEKA